MQSSTKISTCLYRGTDFGGWHYAYLPGNQPQRNGALAKDKRTAFRHYIHFPYDKVLIPLDRRVARATWRVKVITTIQSTIPKDPSH